MLRAKHTSSRKIEDTENKEEIFTQVIPTATFMRMRVQMFSCCRCVLIYVLPTLTNTEHLYLSACFITIRFQTYLIMGLFRLHFGRIGWCCIVWFSIAFNVNASWKWICIYIYSNILLCFGWPWTGACPTLGLNLNIIIISTSQNATSMLRLILFCFCVDFALMPFICILMWQNLLVFINRSNRMQPIWFDPRGIWAQISAS